MFVQFVVDVDVDPGKDFDPVDLMEYMRQAISRCRDEGELTAPGDFDTFIEGVVFYLVDRKEKVDGSL